MLKDNTIPQAALKIMGERLKQIRKEQGYNNYEQFCFTHGFSRSKYSGYENGKNLRVDTLLKLLWALDCSPAYFFEPISDQISQLD